MIINAPRIIHKFLKSRAKFLFNQNKKIIFNVFNKNPRSICFNKDFTSLTISARGIGNLRDNFNKIGLLQAFYRFIGIHSIENNIFLLHGSALVYKNKTLLFGDNGRSVGKTISSLELSFASKKYIGDEFDFINLDSFKIFSDDNIPIHVRKAARNHFSRRHRILISKEFISKHSLNLQFVERRKIDYIFYVNFSSKEKRVKKLSNSVSAKYAMITLSAHVKKLLTPTLDRFQFIKRQDDNITENSEIEAKKRKEFFTKAIKPHLTSASRKIAYTVPSFELFAKEPCDLLPLIEAIIKNDKN